MNLFIMERWLNKVAVVTGASSGIGADIAKRLVEEGLQVVGLARRVEKIQVIADELKEKNARGKLYARHCDMTNEDQILEVFQWIKENLGPIHILVNNAGYIKQESIIEGDSTTWHKTFNTSFMATTQCSRLAMKQMIESNIAGHVIIVNGIMAHRVCQQTVPIMNVYPANKHALAALQELLTQEARLLDTKIKISTISPGLVAKTEIFQKGNIVYFPPEIVEAMPHLNPEDITNGIIYMLSTPPHVQIYELIIKPVGETL